MILAMQWNTVTIEDFKNVTNDILNSISDRYTHRGTDNACVVCLQGDLGAGKTTMTQMIAERLGVIESLQSPTFVIKKIYNTQSEVFKTLIHMDAYRLEGEENLEVLRLGEDFKNPNTLMVIEWPEMISSIIPKDAINIKIEHDGNGRKIQLDNKKTD
ncbi:MAG TPA: tRNA (adenosine(37)-N6)-threonylcarbamoyltransferase complex ATPase subunit type 1 TsaE [Candidatus Paceibacterota bacterium]|nr:tRNA (adenosine(37)-N6)-threonylcarbamoyltransferase complex ATPase subunit type 1 TsaE [Candidatus Paceibacterota bacterium]